MGKKIIICEYYGEKRLILRQQIISAVIIVIITFLDNPFQKVIKLHFERPYIKNMNEKFKYKYTTAEKKVIMKNTEQKGKKYSKTLRGVSHFFKRKSSCAEIMM